MRKCIIVTGAAGFIGSNIVRGLNARGYTNIIAVDNLANAEKFHNLVDLGISDYVDKTTFYDSFSAGKFGSVDAIFHEGACSDTMEHDGRYMLANNYATSKALLDTCASTGTRLLYASSAATYGGSSKFIEDPRFERPLNVYGYSKLLFDQVVRQSLPLFRSQVAGFRYFNVYGPNEQHKGRMASVAYHQFNQFRADGKVKLFGAYDGYGPGQQLRDFVYVDDVVAVNLWFFDNPEHSGVFNLGSGRAQPFNDVAHAVVNSLRSTQDQSSITLEQMVSDGIVEYIDFPQALIGKYQSFTQADLTGLRAVGCNHVFADVATGVSAYVRSLLAEKS
ncbi:ADP-glyceromanno-heptose 6-epimerase [Gluconobacter wancherniae]|uniref:ADP-L-glycero-D-manno-heptose-6-epimerase n=1 Tax=Gluconobacter wancherniae NBRC 103581 TaxID=656744 RepID=A0A511B2G4_9PROT|nr:ADP-glyceromanno-heptose 6-epimerase [Gluconobacter wancherniae]MBF0854485.1 ADP-glyceromanno-heptose 6-epimerase [Gluconobacter wancherniae]GBD57547.1 ADP-L-glycero-D-manno-heptose-6-epimerase [Gluconobacter wancherniae NBRC 103581]GBR62866.1 nucleoside-diphosphate-sugar epimerase [Gluconobacter wancherniae NBRC 103581]GEK93681.1 ADP-L-glycero-D-manno-heptose-6-epimerase [Gluconobacter wancherniae NBRC 103581]